MILNFEEIKNSMAMDMLLSHLGSEVNRKGRCPCPIHGGDGANFAAKGFYGTCFSQCAGKSWSTIDLVMELKNLTYPEALEWIAQKEGITIKYAKGADRSQLLERAKKGRAERGKLLKATAFTLSIYEQKRVYEEKEQYELGGRSFSGETIKAFRLCISPNENLLTERAQGLTPPLVELGLIKHSQKKGTWYDFLRDRLLFPLHNHRGEVVGFSGRRLNDSDQNKPKYLNSSESSIFQKRKLLYGLWQNGRNIREQGALLFEGMADVVTAYDYGICNTIAAGGTAITEQQLRLLKGFTDDLTIVLDGDKAGYEATLKVIQLALATGFSCNVARWREPSEEDKKVGIDYYDPDNYLRQHDKEEFIKYIKKYTEDGLLWAAKEHCKDGGLQAQKKATDFAIQLLSGIENDLLRDFYIRELSKKEYLSRTAKSHLEKGVAVIRKDKLKVELRKNIKITPQQEADILRYGIYIKNNQYWVSADPTIEGYPITNFAIRPVMLIVGSTNSERRVEITNVYGIGFTVNIDSDRFVEIAGFRKEIERHGNYILLEYFQSEHFIKIKRKLYEEMAVCYPIFTLGHHKIQGFFSWSNGIVTDGRFQAVDKHGIVAFEETKFYLPAFAAVSEDILSDDQDNSYEDQKGFRYVADIAAPSITQWSERMKKVHGDKGMMGVSWYLAAVFRDIIYDKLEFFPHLNCFGPPGTGKSFLGWSLSYLFGIARRPFNLHDGTAVGFYRRMAQVRNGIAWFDEYNNNIDHRRAQGLKNAYDGAGREKGVASTDNRTMTTKVNSALLVTGQEMPTQDIALYTRCITMSFSQTSRTRQQKEEAKKLVDIQQTGCLTQITSHLQQYRSHINDHFDQAFDEQFIHLAELVKDKDVLDRLISNYAVPLTVFHLLHEKEVFGFTYGDLLEFAFQNLLWQSESISEEDDLAQWWDAVDYYIAKKQLIHNEDLLVQNVLDIRIRKPKGKRTETEQFSFDGEKKVLFLTLTKAFRFYREQSRKEGVTSLGKDSLRYYLKNSPAYLGQVRGKKFDGMTKSCLAFDLSKLKLELPLSSEICDNEE